MKELKISRDNAIRAFKSADQNGKLLLEALFGQEVLDEKLTERIKTYEDACVLTSIKPLSVLDFLFLPEKDQESSLAHHQLTVIAKCLNDGWEPDWHDNTQHKYYPHFIWGESRLGFMYYNCGWTTCYTAIHSRFVFKSHELAEYAGKQFLSIYFDLIAL
ncbi:hypothetical protein [Dyadobacter sediminis]|uniref:Uncharacterized protein n=1 Tax=Dyadobacter sediminis TaxID=1493691 RepID=A0A5R9KQ50_9BACT|nr:hypothetical protein [Dyadobacter sediminis]TLU98362.1 hypothetical protein FEM55_00345 [Dyadobacter sediminis]GGC14579.1 hypothetical protein GCM10011325_46830 [Dyadobacter sediminis]